MAGRRCQLILFYRRTFVGTLLTGYVIKRIGFNRSYYLASFIFAAGCVEPWPDDWILELVGLAFCRGRRLCHDLGGC